MPQNTGNTGNTGKRSKTPRKCGFLLAGVSRRLVSDAGVCSMLDAGLPMLDARRWLTDACGLPIGLPSSRADAGRGLRRQSPGNIARLSGAVLNCATPVPTIPTAPGRKLQAQCINYTDHADSGADVPAADRRGNDAAGQQTAFFPRF